MRYSFLKIFCDINVNTFVIKRENFFKFKNIIIQQKSKNKPSYKYVYNISYIVFLDSKTFYAKYVIEILTEYIFKRTYIKVSIQMKLLLIKL